MGVYSINRKANIIPAGVLHKENNNIPEHYNMGKKGIPVVSCDTGTKQCVKAAEIEKEELITYKDLSKKIEILSWEYLKSKDDSIALDLGKLMYVQLKNNTIDYSKKFKNK